jgi:hypothetical protein
LISFFNQDYVFHAHILSSFDPSTQCLHRWSRLSRCMSPQKVFFVITYLLEDEQELSLGMLDTSQTYLQFLMLHACSYAICLVFCYTSWHFYAFSGTNLLTRCHSASSLFSAVFVFQKYYTGNILEIGRNKSRTSYYLTKLPEDQRGDREGPRAGYTLGWCGQPLPPPMCETALVHF